MNKLTNCLYCSESIISEFFLTCCVCNKNVHINCLKSLGTPGDLLGDVFFEFTCTGCTENGIEIFIRKKLTWLMVIVITIYNLSIQSQGLSNQGFFHWRTHITYFIEKNWKYLFNINISIKRKKKWIGTVSGILSHHSPEFFCSGQNILKEQGWWKLTHNSTPMFYWKLFEENLLKKHEIRNIKKFGLNPNSSSELNENNLTIKESDDELISTCSRFLPYMGMKGQFKKLNENSEDINNVQLNLREFLEENLSSSDSFFDECIRSKVTFGNIDQNIEIKNENDLLPEESNLTDNIDENHFLECKVEVDYEDPIEFLECTNEIVPRIIQVTNYQENVCNEIENEIDETKILNCFEDVEKESENLPCVIEKSNFTKTVKRRYPWHTDKDETESIKTKNTKLLSQCDENHIFDQLKYIFQLQSECNIEIPAELRRFYNKLWIRRIKKNHFNRTIFNLENFENNVIKNYHKYSCILDRYVHLTTHSKTNCERTFYSRLIHSAEYEIFESPYTSRILHPFIYRSYDCFPTWIKILCQIQHSQDMEKMPTRSSIDFCYIRPHHIAGVNGLLQRMFWPGVDMSECLTYPDFSVVVLYKKLIIGCAFLVPDAGYNEAYISFMAVRPGWNRVGIATFMLYHLTQTCMGKDITLHVSASNPAICLYQKFGFKIEEVVLDFYEQFIPAQSKQSRHAFFLRLKR